METRETITLDARAQQRLFVLNHVLTGGLTAEEAARVLDLSIRQVRRLLRRYRVDGSAGLVHGNRARVPGHRIPHAIRDRVVELATTTYAGVNHTHLAELLAEREGISVAERTLRRTWPRPRSGRPGPAARHGTAAAGSGCRARACCSRSTAVGIAGSGLTSGSRRSWPASTMRPGGCPAGRSAPRRTRSATSRRSPRRPSAMVCGAPSIPTATQIFIVEKNRAPTLAEQLAGKRSLTQVGRALDEATIGWIGAHSAQAKGRVERLWGTLQDRLVSELRLAGSRRSRRPMRSCRASLIATTRGSPSRPPTRPPPGGQIHWPATANHLRPRIETTNGPANPTNAVTN